MSVVDHRPGGLVSLRARLAFVLAGVLAGPVVAAGLVVAVLVPRERAGSETAALRRAGTATSAYLTQRCGDVGDVARAAALDLSAGLSAGEPVDAVRAREVVAAARNGSDAGDVDEVLVAAGNTVLADSGGTGRDVRPLVLASCS